MTVSGRKAISLKRTGNYSVVPDLVWACPYRSFLDHWLYTGDIMHSCIITINSNGILMNSKLICMYANDWKWLKMSIIMRSVGQSMCLSWWNWRKEATKEGTKQTKESTELARRRQWRHQWRQPSLIPIIMPIHQNRTVPAQFPKTLVKSSINHF